MQSFPKRFSVVLIPLLVLFASIADISFAFGNDEALKLKTGSHLFIDDFLIASSSNVVRRPVTLAREILSEMPVITATQHYPFQPFFTVIRDNTMGNFRIWYGVPTAELSHMRSRIAYLESKDGIHWTNAARILEIGPIQFGVSVIDGGPAFSDSQHRFKLGWHMDNGLKIATSPDGLEWEHLTTNVVISHNHDINGIFHDALRQRYIAMLSFYETGDGWTGKRRFTKQSHSTNLLNWSEPFPIITPDARDEGETQFYSMDGFLTRGELLVGMVKVLRDDLKADNPPEPPDAYGIGYTTLAWTRDGKQWTRERAAFLDRNPRKGAWDHAHAWIDEQVLVGDDVYLYYGGYKSGHKVNRFQERQIGLIKMKRDRYVARETSGQGMLRTRPLIFSGKKLFINARADEGEIRVRLLTPEGEVRKGFGFDDCVPVRSDGIRTEVKWKKRLSKNVKTPLVLEFQLRNAALFGFEIE